jgi:outer membrane autotransporter protein
VIGFAASQGTAALALRGLADGALDTRLSKLAMLSRPVGRIDAYASFDYGTGDRATEGWRPKFSYDAQVVTAGFDAHVRQGMILGTAIDTGRLEAKLGAGGGNYKVQNQTGRLYGLWHGDPVIFSIDADYGALSINDAHRTTAFGGFQTNGKTGGTHWGAGAKITWLMDAGGFNLRPWLGLHTERVKLDAYTERDVPSLTMAFAAQEAKSSAGSIGLDFTGDSKLSARPVHFDFSVAWHSEFSDKTRGVTGQLANNFTPPTVVSITDGDGSGFALGAAATLLLNKTWSVSLGYHGDIRQGDKLASRIGLSVQTGF